jgi:hypothetical protein
VPQLAREGNHSTRRLRVECGGHKGRRVLPRGAERLEVGAAAFVGGGVVEGDGEGQAILVLARGRMIEMAPRAGRAQPRGRRRGGRASWAGAERVHRKACACGGWATRLRRARCMGSLAFSV